MSHKEFLQVSACHLTREARGITMAVRAQIKKYLLEASLLDPQCKMLGEKGMEYHTLIDIDSLLPHINDPKWAIIDCRFSLDNTERGWRDYQHSHIQGAVYAHLDEDLCAPIVSGVTGRHPLPPVEQLVERFSKWGIDRHVQVVAYDDWTPASGGIAARLWWSLRWLGHTTVAILDGGWAAWNSVGGPSRGGKESRKPRTFVPRIRPELLATSNDVDQWRKGSEFVIFDSRALDRFRGENETIDPVAGHIPGAKPAPYIENANLDGSFLPVEKLRERFQNLLGNMPADQAVFYCGSGVTAAHNLLALAHAGLGEARLYAGSWSEWITDSKRPISVGED